MFSYYLQLGLRSLRRNPMLTALMVMAIGFGVAASMTTYSVFRATSRDPIPQKSDVLYNVQIDNWGPENTQIFWLTALVFTAFPSFMFGAPDGGRFAATPDRPGLPPR